MNRILDVDVPNQRAVVQPGVVNLTSRSGRALDLLPLPIPISQKSCTIGGKSPRIRADRNAANGVTVNHAPGSSGTSRWAVGEFGGKNFTAADTTSPDSVVGSEGNARPIATKIRCGEQLLESVATLLASLISCGRCERGGSDHAEGITPRRSEWSMDGTTRGRGRYACRVPKSFRRGAADRDRRIARAGEEPRRGSSPIWHGWQGLWWVGRGGGGRGGAKSAEPKMSARATCGGRGARTPRSHGASRRRLTCRTA